MVFNEIWSPIGRIITIILATIDLLSPSVSTGLSLLASAALESDHQQQVQHDHHVVVAAAAAARQRRFSSSNDENNSLNGNNAINLSTSYTTK